MDTAILTLPMIPRHEIVNCIIKVYRPNLTKNELPIFHGYMRGVADDLRDLGFQIESLDIKNPPPF